jgi:hypothetical protein
MLSRIKFEITPLVNEMLDRLPDEVWTSKTTTFFDPAIAGGQFVREIERRLLEAGHSKKNIAGRVFGCEEYEHQVQYALNKYKLLGNYTVTKFLEQDFNMKFDVIVGNPPFQRAEDSGDKRDSAANLWPEFVVKSFNELLNDDGYIGFVTPNGWMTPSADVGKGSTGIRIYDFITEYQTLALNINECKKYFSVGSSFTYYVIKKSKNTTSIPTNIITVDERFTTDLSSVKYCPSIFNKISLSLNTKVLNSTLPVIGFTNNNTGPGKKFAEDIVEQKDSNHSVKCYHSSADNGTYVYSSINLPEVRKKKVMVCSSGNFLPIYDNGNIGFTYKIYVYYLNQKESLDSIKSYLSSKLIRTILDQNKTSGWVSYAFRLLPKIDFTKIWTDRDLYKLFKLSKEEIEYIESSFE